MYSQYLLKKKKKRQIYFRKNCILKDLSNVFFGHPAVKITQVLSIIYYIDALKAYKRDITRPRIGTGGNSYILVLYYLTNKNKYEKNKTDSRNILNSVAIS